MRKTFKYRIYPTKAQEQELLRWLAACRRLYNVLLEQRMLAYQRGIRLNKYQQMREITELRKAMPKEYGRIGSHVLQDVAKRLDKSFERFFAGAGYPKFQSARRYNSFTFLDHAGWKLRDGRLHITNIGSIKVKWSRPIEGTIKTLTKPVSGTLASPATTFLLRSIRKQTRRSVSTWGLRRSSLPAMGNGIRTQSTCIAV